MPRLQGTVSIAAPAERVWDAVLEDLAGMPRWAGYMRSASVVGGGRPGLGTKVRYELNVPGDIALVMLPRVWDRPHLGSGDWVEGPITGTWSYQLAEAANATDLTYEMEIRLGGMLRFASGMIQGRLDSGISDAMRRLQEELEAR
ncbi:MAG: SRPBCC family protein [Candidatus Dormibacteraceae bacterium]